MNQSSTTMSDAGSSAANWRVRSAESDDATGIVAALASLLEELGATPPPLEAMQATTEALLEDPELGALLVAEADGALIGVLAVSWQSAIHVPGRYCLIQDLWVRPSWRSKAVGAALLRALFEHAAELGIEHIEVGLPREGFSGRDATETFYADNGFVLLGPRMRRASR